MYLKLGGKVVDGAGLLGRLKPFGGGEEDNGSNGVAKSVDGRWRKVKGRRDSRS
jgi:hypothetical protein